MRMQISKIKMQNFDKTFRTGVILGCFIISCASYCEAQQDGTLLWSFEGSESMGCVASIRDVNGNGISDVLAGKWSDTLYCFEGASQDTATIIWKFAIGNTQFSIVDVDSIPDVNNDGIPDVIVGCSGAYCLDGQTGNIIWKFPMYYFAVVEPIGDVNSDGICDVILGIQQAFKIYCIDGASIDSASVLWEFPVEGLIRESKSISSLKDIDGDSVREVLVAVGHSKGKMFLPQESIVYCISGKTGDTIWTYDVPEPIACGISYIEDVNDNGTQDVLVTTQNPGKVYCLEGSNGNVIWKYACSSSMGMVISISDINGDGKQEALAGGANDTVICIEGDSDSLGNMLWAFSTHSASDNIPNCLDVISDVDNDTIPDIVAGTWRGFVYCISAKTGDMIWRYHGPDTSQYATIQGLTGITDVNGDGFDDVVAVTYGGGAHYGEVWCLSSKTYGVEESELIGQKSEVRLFQNEPNPFLQGTSIKYQVTRKSKVSLKIYDLTGRVVKVLVDGEVGGGVHKVIWDRKDESGKLVPSGIYFSRLELSGSTIIKKLVAM